MYLKVQTWGPQKHVEAVSESVCPSQPPIIFPPEHRSHLGSFLDWSLKDFHFQKQDGEDGFKVLSVESQNFVLVRLQGII